MSLYENLDTETFVAGANLNGLLYALLALDATDPSRVVVAAAEDAYCVGILAHDPKRSRTDASDTTGDVVTVAKLKGKVPMIASATITAGHFVHATTSGQIVGAGGAGFSDLTAGDYIIGKAMEGGVAGQVITVHAQPFYAGAAV